MCMYLRANAIDNLGSCNRYNSRAILLQGYSKSISSEKCSNKTNNWNFFILARFDHFLFSVSS